MTSPDGEMMATPPLSFEKVGAIITALSLPRSGSTST
jgi:hypothetical protein